MLVIGLTGGIGSGKSTVSALLAARGAVVVDADAIVRDVQQPGTPTFRAMVERFGPGIVADDGTLDRAAGADLVFDDPEGLADLNGIVHPAVGAESLRRVEELAGAAGGDTLAVRLAMLGGRPDIEDTQRGGTAVGPRRLAGLQPGAGTGTPEVVPFQGKTTSRAKSTRESSGRAP